MNLDQLLSLEGIKDYNIFWFGTDIADNYMNDDGPIVDTLELSKSRPRTEDTIYIIMSGINKYKCRYRFAAKMIKTENDKIFRWERVPIKLDEYAGRMIFYRERGFSFYNNDVTGPDFILEETWGKKEERTVVPFNNYDEVELSFNELREIIDGHYYDYYDALSVVKGIYMIIDGNTGKLYVGSAYGGDGIWGRWSSYAATCHGGNYELQKLYDQYGEEYFYKFKYIILQILPMRMSDKEVIEMESKYKNRYPTREFGLNDN